MVLNQKPVGLNQTSRMEFVKDWCEALGLLGKHTEYYIVFRQIYLRVVQGYSACIFIIPDTGK